MNLYLWKIHDKITGEDKYHLIEIFYVEGKMFWCYRANSKAYFVEDYEEKEFIKDLIQVL